MWFVNGRWHACSRWFRKADFGAVASVWPPISEVFSDAPERALCQAQRTFFLLPAEMFLFPGSFSTSPGSLQRRRRNLPSLYETGLKIRWTYHPCGFESHHRHHGPFSRGLFLCVAGPEKRLYMGIFCNSIRVPPPNLLQQSSPLSPTFRPFDPARSLLSFSPFQHF